MKRLAVPQLLALPLVLLTTLAAGCGADPANNPATTRAQDGSVVGSSTSGSTSSSRTSSSSDAEDPVTASSSDRPRQPSDSIPYSTIDPLPTLPRPTAPDPKPSDQITGWWAVGAVTEIGDGCAAFTTDSGTPYSISGSALGSPAVGQRLKARIVFLENGPTCGPGESMRVLEVKPIR